MGSLTGFFGRAAALGRGVTCSSFWQAGCTLAAVTGQEGNQFIHGVVGSGIADETADPFTLDQAHPAQVSKVKRECGSGHPDTFANGAGIHALRAGFDKQAKDGEAGFVPEGGEKFGGVQCFHISIILEI